MSYEAWQYCPGVIAIRLNARLCWKDVHGKVTTDAPEPIYLLDGALPEYETGQRRMVETLKKHVLSVYNSLEFVAQAWWEETNEAQPAESAPVSP